MNEIIVRVGYHNEVNDQRRPIKFEGKELITATNYANDKQHANNRRYHNWTLYEVENGYRVLDEFFILFPNESNHTGLSAILRPAEVAKAYPVLTNKAIDKGLWTLGETASEASDREEPGKPAPIEYKYDQRDFNGDK